MYRVLTIGSLQTAFLGLCVLWRELSRNFAYFNHLPLHPTIIQYWFATGTELRFNSSAWCLACFACKVRARVGPFLLHFTSGSVAIINEKWYISCVLSICCSLSFEDRPGTSSKPFILGCVITNPLRGSSSSTGVREEESINIGSSHVRGRCGKSVICLSSNNKGLFW